MEVYLLRKELLSTFVPILVYWLYSGIYMSVMGYFDKYRLHSKKEEEQKNLVSMKTVIKGVLLQQTAQALFALLVFTVRKEEIHTHTTIYSSFLMEARSFLVAMMILDSWQYFMHRYMHYNKFLYRHVHSWHHKLVIPYAFGGLYNHPFEGFLDTIGGALSFLVSGMSVRSSIFFFSFINIKTVDDHCGLWLPGNPFHMLFKNNSAYHDIHHQLYGNKYNYSQPFFVLWDRILGTYMAYTIEERQGGGVRVRAARSLKD